MTKNGSTLISFIIPVKDEETSLKELHEGISVEMRKLECPFEIVFIDDGSIDGSWKVLSELAADHPNEVIACRFRSNSGKADALAAGFQAAHGTIVFTMDADLQDDPQEIPRFIEKLNEGFDIVSGWKKIRHDPWHKVLPSRLFNLVVSSLLGVKLHDHNCGFKCYRAEVIKDVALYGDMHRLIPSLAGIKGYRSTEIRVKHHPRKFGKSKYGVKRFFTGFADVLTVYFHKNFRERPLHFFGGIAALGGIIGMMFFALGLLPWLSPFIASRVTTLAEIFLISAPQVLGIGFLAEMIVRGHVENEVRSPAFAEVIAKTGSFPQPAHQPSTGGKSQLAPSTEPRKASNGNGENIVRLNQELELQTVRQHLVKVG